ncbi:uncharacterized protein ACBT57_004631 [Dama dama]
MARYLGPGDGEGLPLSRRGSSLRPAGPGALLAPRPEASGPVRPLLRAAPLPARAGPPPSSRAAPRQGRGRGVPLSLGARLPSPAPAPWAAAEPRGGREAGLRRTAGGYERGLRHSSRSVTAAAVAATTTRAVLLLPTCREDTEHARAETTSGAHMAFRILVLQPGMEPMPPAFGAWSLNHWTTREVTIVSFGDNGIFLIQGSNPHLLHLLPTAPPGKPPAEL